MFFMPIFANSYYNQVLNMTIGDNKAAVLAYKIQLDNTSGEVLEQVNIETPRTIIFGKGTILPSFESGLKGLKAGEKFVFTIAPENAFGLYRDDQIIELSKENFMVDGTLREDLLKVGTIIPMTDENGHHFEGKVKSVSETMVEMDFNHSLAGKSLLVSGEVISIREATEEEMTSNAHSCGDCCDEKDSCCDGGGHHHHGGCCY
jgi:FKBP-type peptidyl-prolyl cis-trans isomerase SlyD